MKVGICASGSNDNFENQELKDRMRVLKHFKPQFISLIKEVVQTPSNDFLKVL